jgi:hypothetical protein
VRPAGLRARLVLLALAVLALFAGALPAVVAVPAVGVTFALTPGLVLARLLAPRARPAKTTLLAMVISPLLVGGGGAALLALGVGSRAAALAVVAGAGALTLVPWPPREELDEPESVVPWVAGTAWAAVVLAFLLGNHWLLTRADGWFHAAVILQIAQRGLPVEDPFFAGMRLLYFWGYHVRGAMWLGLAPQLSVWVPVLSPQVAGAVGVMIGVALLAQRLGASARGQALATLVAAFGYAPFAWIRVVGRVLLGDVRGMDEIRQILLQGVDPVLGALGAGTLHPSMAFFGDKFLIPTPFALGLAAFLAFTICLLDALEQPLARRWTILGLVQASALFLHSVVGAANVLMAGVWGVWTLTRARRRPEAHLRTAFFALAAAAAGAVLLLLPYLAATLAGKQQTITFGLDLRGLSTWLLAGGLYVFAGMPWLMRRSAAPGTARELWGLAWGLTLAALLLQLPLGNQSKLFNLLFALLAAPAALQLIEWVDACRGGARTLLVGAIVLALAPTVLLCAWGFASEARQLEFSSEAPRSRWVEDAYRWAAVHTPSNTVFVDPASRLGMAVVAGRSALWGGERWADNWGYDPESLEVRRLAVRELATGRVSERTRRLIRELDRPVVLVHRRQGPYADSTATPPLADEAGRWRLLYENDGVTLYVWKENR